MCPQAAHYEVEGHPFVHVMSVHVTLANCPAMVKVEFRLIYRIPIVSIGVLVWVKEHSSIS